MFSVVRRTLPAAAALAAGRLLVGGALVGGLLVGGGLAAPAAALASTTKPAPQGDPTITIRVGGIRTAESGPPGPPAVSGLDGVTFRVTPSSAGHPDTCVSNALGLCTLDVDANRTYTLTQTGTPSGWFASAQLGAGTVSPNNVTARPYSTLSVGVGTSNVTVPVPAPNSDGSPTARSGTWALSKDNPSLPDGCGLRIALLFDLSSSVTTSILPTYQAAGRAFVSALQGTPSSIAVYTFGTTAPAPGANNATLVPPVSVATGAGVTTLNNKINGLSVPTTSYTNWDAGIWQIANDNSTYHYQAAIVLTDGDPTRYGPSGALGGNTSTVMTRFAEAENGIFSANALKAAGTTVLGVGIGTQPEGLAETDNLRAISGPVENTDYFNTDFGRLRNVLTELALRNCAGLDLAKTAAPPAYAHVGDKITYTYTVTNPKFFTLDNVHVTDDRIPGPIPCMPSTLPTNATATCTATHEVTQADIDAGHIKNTAVATGTTPNGDDVPSLEAEATVRARQAPAIEIVKSAFPTQYAVPGEMITYTYTVTNAGNVTLRDVRVLDNRLGAITCLNTELAPGKSTTCEAIHTTTDADVDAGRIANAATATGDPPTGPPVTGGDDEIVTGIQRPGIAVEKAAFPVEYGAAGERVTYTYTVVNTGNVTLRNVTLHDNRLGVITCPAAMLAPGETMTCLATRITTPADVEAGHVVNFVTATGQPPTGPPVTDGDTETVGAIHAPGIGLEKVASRTTYEAAGETITYTYTVVNTGNVRLRGITVADNQVRGPIACQAATLAPGESTTCRAAHTVTESDMAAGRIINVATAAGQPPAGSQVTDKDEAMVILAEPEVPVTG